MNVASGDATPQLFSISLHEKNLKQPLQDLFQSFKVILLTLTNDTIQKDILKQLRQHKNGQLTCSQHWKITQCTFWDMVATLASPVDQFMIFNLDVHVCQLEQLDFWAQIDWDIIL